MNNFCTDILILNSFALTYSCITLKNGQALFKIKTFRCKHRKLFKVCLTIFHSCMKGLTYFMQLVSFYTSWKHQKISGILIFSGGIDTNRRHEMSGIAKPSLLFFCQFRLWFIRKHQTFSFLKTQDSFQSFQFSPHISLSA